MVSKLGDLSFLLFCSFGVFLSYLIYGILQEKLTKSKYGDNDPFNYFISMLFFQCIINSMFAVIALLFKKEARGKVKESNFALCGFTYVGAMFASNYSLKFVPYPTQVISKSIKPIPVMLLNVILAKRRYPIRKYLFVTMISAGVFLFMYKGGVQESLSKHSIGSYTLMLHMNLWSVLYLALALVFTGEGSAFMLFTQRHPVVLMNLALFGISSGVGQIFLFTLLTNFGSLMCSIVTTTRKFFTVLASIILFSHVMSTQQWVGTLLVFFGIFLDQLYGKTRQKPSVKNDSAASSKMENKLKSP